MAVLQMYAFEVTLCYSGVDLRNQIPGDQDSTYAHIGKMSHGICRCTTASADRNNCASCGLNVSHQMHSSPGVKIGKPPCARRKHGGSISWMRKSWRWTSLALWPTASSRGAIACRRRDPRTAESEVRNFLFIFHQPRTPSMNSSLVGASCLLHVAWGAASRFLLCLLSGIHGPLVP